MRILIISKECDSIDLGRRLVEEGNQVKFYCDTPGYERVGIGFGIKKVADWKRELGWVGKSGLIIFDYTGFGKTQDELRAQGYAVVGGCAAADRLELDRDYANDILRGHGLTTVPLYHLSVPAAIKHIENNEGPWVIKHNGYADKTLTYVGRMPDGCDVIDLLKSYRKQCKTVVIQKKVSGVEIGVARFFNGFDWTGPIEMNVEHKKLCSGDLGPKTSEMGTLMWFDGNERNKLFNATIGRLTPWLRRENFRGDIDINCIINEEGVFPLEITARFGYPALHGSCALTCSPFGDFLKAVAGGRAHDIAYPQVFGVVIQVVVPPFPYQGLSDRYNPEGLKIYFKQKPTLLEMNHIHFSDVMKRRCKNGDSEYIIVSRSGYVLCVTGVGDTAEQACDKAYGLIDKIVIPKMFFRHDIGGKFIHKDRDILKMWGYV